ncbi:MAG: DUF554 family protein [candidate division NC10 bacterium]|nr:DUF554 family protein [candidate division NC10 bacterium]
MRGTLVNVVAVLLGSGLGLLIGNRLPEKIKKVITTGLGLSTILIGVQMAFKAENVLIIIMISNQRKHGEDLLRHRPPLH